MTRMLFLLLLGAALALASCSGSSSGGEEEGRGGRGGGQAKSDPLVEVLPVRRSNIARFERSTGRVEAHDVADVYARISEVALAVFFDVGDRVEIGDELARLDPTQYELDLRSAELALAEADLTLVKLESELEKAEHDLNRILARFDPEHPERSAVFTKDDYLTARLARDKAANEVETSGIQQAKAAAEVERKKLQLAQTVIRAPIRGVVTQRAVRPNELVAASAMVFQISDLSRLEVNLDIPEAGLRYLREPERTPGISLFSLREKLDLSTAQAVLLSATAWPEARFLGWLERVAPTVDAERGMARITVRVVQPDEVDELLHEPLLDQLDINGRSVIETASLAREKGASGVALRPGMWMDARIAVEVRKETLVAPAAALVGDSEEIWVVRPDQRDAGKGTALKVSVEGRRGVSSEGTFELLPADAADEAGHAFAEGDLIVVRGQSLLRDGQAVRIIDLSKR